MDHNTENEVLQQSLVGADPLTLAKEIIRVLDTKNAENIKLLHVEKNTIIADYFVICTGNSNTQIRAFAGELEYRLGLRELPPHNIEGYEEASWVLLDYSSVIVHIFNSETRNFYNLEKLWSDATEIDVSDLVTEK